MSQKLHKDTLSGWLWSEVIGYVSQELKVGDAIFEDFHLPSTRWEYNVALISNKTKCISFLAIVLNS